MATPANSVVYPVYGQALNISAVVKSLVTGNPLTGGLTGLVAYVRRDDGAFALTTSYSGGASPVEGGTSGWVSLDLTAEMMTARKVDVEIRASNTNAVYACVAIVTMDLRPPTIRWDLEAVMRYERMGLNTFDYWFNETFITVNQSMTISNRNGGIFATAPVQNSTTLGFCGKFV